MLRAFARFYTACTASAMDFTNSPTGPAASSPYFAMILTIALPTMAPSDSDVIFAACCGLEIPKPTAQGMSVADFTSFVIAAISVVIALLVPGDTQ